MKRVCLVEGCGEAVSAVRPICAGHFAQLPGKVRSRLTLSTRFGGSWRTDEAFAAAAASINTEGNGE